MRLVTEKRARTSVRAVGGVALVGIMASPSQTFLLLLSVCSSHLLSAIFAHCLDCVGVGKGTVGF